MPRGQKLRFQIVASDGRCSDIWRVWSVRDDVYLAPRSKGGEFKISLHQSGRWRLAFTKEYAEVMYGLGTWDSDRCVESLDRPRQHAPGFTRAVWLYFLDMELRLPVNPRKRDGIVEVPGPSRHGIRVVNVVFTTAESRFTQADPPLGGSLGAKPIVAWTLPNGEILWVVHFELSGSRGLDDEAEQFRRNVSKAKKLDDRSPLHLNDISGRIMIAGTNDQGWFCVIDAALS